VCRKSPPSLWLRQTVSRRNSRSRTETGSIVSISPSFLERWNLPARLYHGGPRSDYFAIPTRLMDIRAPRAAKPLTNRSPSAAPSRSLSCRQPRADGLQSPPAEKREPQVFAIRELSEHPKVAIVVGSASAMTITCRLSLWTELGSLVASGSQARLPTAARLLLKTSRRLP
jgi:hypothetical protein